MGLYNFKNLVTRYSKGQVFAITETEGHHDTKNGGKWVDGKKKKFFCFQLPLYL